jgi:hypothetical protein
MFLLSAAPMGLSGCAADGDDDGASTYLTAMSDESSDATSGDGDGEAGDGDGDEAGDGDGDPTGDGDGDGDPTGDGDGDGDGDGGLCSDYAELMASCNDFTSRWEELCLANLEYAATVGPECYDVMEAQFICLSQLTCDDVGMGGYCLDEMAEVNNVCYGQG